MSTSIKVDGEQLNELYRTLGLDPSAPFSELIAEAEEVVHSVDDLHEELEQAKALEPESKGGLKANVSGRLLNTNADLESQLESPPAVYAGLSQTDWLDRTLLLAEMMGFWDGAQSRRGGTQKTRIEAALLSLGRLCAKRPRFLMVLGQWDCSDDGGPHYSVLNEVRLLLPMICTSGLRYKL